jgi:hypothetical protein
MGAGDGCRSEMKGTGLLSNRARQSRRQVCAGARMRRPALRADSPAVLGLVARRETRFAHCVRSARAIATSMRTKRAARAATSPALLGAAYVAADAHPPAALLMHRSRRRHTPIVTARGAVPGGSDLWGGEKRRLEAGTRAARASTSDSPRLFQRNERSEWSEFRGAASGRASQRSRPSRPTATVGAPAGCRSPRRPNRRTAKHGA